MDQTYNLRRCVVTKSGYDPENAYFHEFGTKAAFANNGDDRIAVTIAIVEMLDGRIETVEPDSIQFVDEFPKDPNEDPQAF